MPTEPADPLAAAISQIEGIVQGADATAITGAVFTAAGVGYNPEFLAFFQAAISEADDGALNTLAKIKAMINTVTDENF